MSDVDDLVTEIHPRLVAELQALHNGDPQPRLAMWSTKDPVTLLGAGMSGRGWDKVYRREGGEWKVVHRHGDQIAIDQGQPLPGEASTA